MASPESRRWEGNTAWLARFDRSPYSYEVYMPDQRVGRRFILDGAVAAGDTRVPRAPQPGRQCPEPRVGQSLAGLS